MKKIAWFSSVSTETKAPTHLLLKLLLGLILIDLFILGLNFYNSWIPDEQWNPFFALANDDSLGELVQYFKWFSITAIFVYLAVKRSSICYLAWALIFLYLLLDDWLGIHENVGAYLMQNFSFATPGGLRLQDIGELAVSAIAGSFLLIVSVWAYIKSDDFYKITTHSMLYLFIALVFFGVFIDVVAVMTYTGNISAFLFDVVEDGGEMIVASFMLWFIVLVSKEEGIPITLMKSIRSFFLTEPKVNLKYS